METGLNMTLAPALVMILTERSSHRCTNSPNLRDGASSTVKMTKELPSSSLTQWDSASNKSTTNATHQECSQSEAIDSQSGRENSRATSIHKFNASWCSCLVRKEKHHSMMTLRSCSSTSFRFHPKSFYATPSQEERTSDQSAARFSFRCVLRSVESHGPSTNYHILTKEPWFAEWMFITTPETSHSQSSHFVQVSTRELPSSGQRQWHKAT